MPKVIPKSIAASYCEQPPPVYIKSSRFFQTRIAIVKVASRTLVSNRHGDNNPLLERSKEFKSPPQHRKIEKQNYANSWTKTARRPVAVELLRKAETKNKTIKRRANLNPTISPASEPQCRGWA